LTVLAGFFYRGQTAGSDQTLRADLVATLSRNPADRIEEVQSGRCFLAKIDIGAFGASGVCRGPDGATTMLVGDPIGEQRAADPARTRAADAQEIHQALLVGNLTPLSTSRGAFCVAHHDEARGRLVLATDRAGLRPMYFCNDGEHVVFATALRILESIPSVRKVLHLAGFADLVHFGTELGNRSPYLGIKRLRAGEMLVVGERETKTSFYWKWDDLQESSESPDRLAQTGADVVAESVSVRTGTIRSTTSMLTGGLDSRVIVTLLRERGIDVRSINFSIAGSQDQTFAPHRTRRSPASSPNSLAHSMRSGLVRRAHLIRICQLCWSSIFEVGTRIISRIPGDWFGTGSTAALLWVMFTYCLKSFLYSATIVPEMLLNHTSDTSESSGLVAPRRITLRALVRWRRKRSRAVSPIATSRIQAGDSITFTFHRKPAH